MAVLKNEKGFINIADDAIAKLVGMIINDASCYGIVGMSSKKAADGLYQLFNIANMDKGIRITSPVEGMVNIELHIVVEYGTPINVIAGQAMDTIRYNIHEMTGLNVDQFNIIVEGVRV